VANMMIAAINWRTDKLTIENRNPPALPMQRPPLRKSVVFYNPVQLEV
jgi:hypothetical protein